MIRSELCALLRKGWWIPALVIAALAVLAGVVHVSGFDVHKLLSQYGYLVIFVWTCLEGETIVIISGIYAAQSHQMSPLFIALAAFCGSFLGDQIMFSLGKYKGPLVLRLFPRMEQKMEKVARLFRKYDNALILGFRFVYGVRNITPIMLGISGVSHKKFFCLNAIGAAAWALAFSFGGYYSGKAFVELMNRLGHGILLLLLAAAALAGIIWFLRSRKAARQERESASAEPGGPAEGKG
ncbi:MAG: DedA family protein [Desulfovibrio sp.]|nr:DedA family protein [Desulfovibrio sp.]